MRKHWAVIAGLTIAAASASAQGTTGGEFAETAPPKVAVGLEQNVEAPPQLPADNESEKSSIDLKIEAVGQSMAGADVDPDQPDASAPPSEPDDFSPASALLNGLMALCAVLALFFLLVYLGKRFGKRTPLLAGQQLGQVMGRVSLSPQAALHFVRTNGEVLVVGVTQQSVTLLRSFDATDFEPESATTEEPTQTAALKSSFLEQLREAQEAMPAQTRAVDEDLDSLKGDLQRLQQYIQESARARE